MENWTYIGIFLDDISKATLKTIFKIPEDWKWYGDHVTLCYNNGSELANIAKKINMRHLNQTCTLEIIGVGFSENALALKVKLTIGLVCTNKVAHIIIGAKHKPVDSNNIEIWHEINKYILFGKVGII